MHPRAGYAAILQNHGGPGSARPPASRPDYLRFHPVPHRELSPFIRDFISRHVRSVEQLEILLLFSRDVSAVWSARKVYDAILSSPHSVERWLDELSKGGLLEKLPDSGGYTCCTDETLVSQIAALAEYYRTSPVRVVEAIYKRGPHAAQSFADAFMIKKSDEPTP